MSTASSSIVDRTRSEVSSPKCGKSPHSFEPRPTPTTRRPPESRLTVEAWRATIHGRRRGSGVTVEPTLTVRVLAAIALSEVQQSAIGAVSLTTWSHRKTPSQPAASARTASSTSTRGSPKGPKGGRYTPCRSVGRVTAHFAARAVRSGSLGKGARRGFVVDPGCRRLLDADRRLSPLASRFSLLASRFSLLASRFSPRRPELSFWRRSLSPSIGG